MLCQLELEEALNLRELVHDAGREQQFATAMPCAVPEGNLKSVFHPACALRFQRFEADAVVQLQLLVSHPPYFARVDAEYARQEAVHLARRPVARAIGVEQQDRSPAPAKDERRRSAQLDRRPQ